MNIQQLKQLSHQVDCLLKMHCSPPSVPQLPHVQLHLERHLQVAQAQQAHRVQHEQHQT